MPLRVVLVRQIGIDAPTAESTARMVNQVGGPLTVEVFGRPLDLPGKRTDAKPWSQIFEALANWRHRERVAPDVFVHLLMSSPNDLNWFAGENEKEMRTSFGHVTDFSWATTAPSAAIGAHYVCKAVMNAVLAERDVDWQALWHQEPRGCFFDFCGQKTDIAFKLRTADICGDCLNVLQEGGIDDGFIRQLVEVMDSSRRSAMAASRYLPQSPTLDDHLPFPVAVTKHKAVQTSDKLHRFLLLIDHFDSLIRYAVVVSRALGGVPLSPVDRPALGWWVEQLASDPSFHSVVALARHERLVSLRNEYRGHGWMANRQEAYEEIGESFGQAVREVEERMMPFLRSHRLEIPRALSVVDGRYVVNGQLLQGSNALHPQSSTQLARAPLEAGLANMHEVYAYVPTTGTYVALAPGILSARCPECKHDRVLITDGGDRYIDVFVGHRVTLPVGE